MAKFKVGDRVKILIDGTYGTVDVVLDGESCGVIKSGEKIGRYYPFCYLELVEPEKVFDFRNHSITLNANMLHGLSFGTTVLLTPYQMKQLSITTRNQFSDFKTECEIRNLKLVEKPLDPKQDNPFKLDPHEFEKSAKIYQDIFGNITFPEKAYYGSRNRDIFNDIKEVVRESVIKGIIKNRIPDRVVFNEAKGKVTVLISKFNDGEAPYRAYTSKVNVESGDKYDAQFGFLLSYYKYLIRRLGAKEQKEMIERVFNLLPTKRYPYLLGAVENEVLKISDVVKSYKDWEELYVAITEPCEKGNGTWDYLEWKEMLRVHELETKREKQREVSKEIKKHQKEIDRLKREG